MIVPNDNTRRCLLHWCGEELLDSPPFLMVQQNLEGNTRGPDVLQSFGQSTIPAYVGFIDLAGFSTAVQGKSPDQIASYLNPFLTKTIAVLTDRNALVDKMIGDEIMFVLPEYDGINSQGTLLSFGQLLGGLHDLAFDLAPEYSFRIGLSYGLVRFYHLNGDGYSEWSVVGEPIHIAKRLHSVEELATPNPVCGAYGLSLSDQSLGDARDKMQLHMNIAAGCASRFSHQIVPEPKQFKGVGPVLWAHLESKRIAK